jgi:hypothetical protein
LTEYKTIVVIEPHSVVLQNLSHLFTLPIQYAYAFTNNEIINDNNEKEMMITDDGHGLMVLHPCRGVYSHMLELLHSYPVLRFNDGHGEQHFIDW